MLQFLMAVVVMGMAGGAYAVQFDDLAVKAEDLKASVAAKVAAVEPDFHPMPAPGNWVAIAGGKFKMVTDNGVSAFEREVAIESFEMSKTAVTVEQYASCVNEGACTEPATGDSCNWGKPGRELHPVNCVDWAQADQYAKFKGARLPSEAEWAFAATSGGKDQKYPWGNEAPACDKAVMAGCGNEGTMPVCSKPAGNTAYGLCDMAGNVWQWTQDKAGPGRVVRGSAFYSQVSPVTHADSRGKVAPGSRNVFLGFRLARAIRYY